MADAPEVLVMVTGVAGAARLIDAAERAKRFGQVEWLAPRTAFELTDFAIPPGQLLRLAQQGFGEDTAAALAADIALVPVARRRKQLLVADMDSTIIGEECIDELAAIGGVGSEVAAITGQAMRGEIDFLPALEARVAMLQGIEAEVIERILAERIRLNPGARTLVATMRANGARTALVSGGFTQFVERIAERAGFECFQANTLEIARGRLTGRLVPPILDQSAKASELGRLANEQGIDLADTLAVGDGSNDVEMVRSAGLGVAYRAKPVLERAAHVSIRHGDLTALLYLQGYRREEHVD